MGARSRAREETVTSHVCACLEAIDGPGRPYVAAGRAAGPGSRSLAAGSTALLLLGGDSPAIPVAAVPRPADRRLRGLGPAGGRRHGSSGPASRGRRLDAPGTG